MISSKCVDRRLKPTASYGGLTGPAGQQIAHILLHPDNKIVKAMFSPVFHKPRAFMMWLKEYF